jgi:glycerate kinase
MHVISAGDKFRGTVLASEFGEIIAEVCNRSGFGTCHVLPLSDGGEGFLDAMGGQQEVLRDRPPR